MGPILLLYAVISTVLLFARVPWWARLLGGVGYFWCAYKMGFIPDRPFGQSARDLMLAREARTTSLPHSHAAIDEMAHFTAGGLRIRIGSIKVEGGLSKTDALTGLTNALPHLHRAVMNSAADAICPSGSIAVSFRTEPDGMIRMVLQGATRMTGAHTKALVDDFNESTMSHKWQFPQSSGPSLVEVEFAVGQH